MQNNWPQLIGLVLIVGFSLISWIYRKLNEQAAKKRQRDLIEERQREMLRTGRDPGEVGVGQAPSAETERQREITARREAQLAELRRRAQMRQHGVDPGKTAAPPTALPSPTGPPPLISIPGSTGPTVPQIRRTPFQAPPLPRPRPVATPVQRSAPRQRPQQKQPKKPPSARSVVDESSTHRLVPEETARRPSPVVYAAAPQSPEEWRRAIIANEILSPPLAIRGHDVAVPF